MYIKKKIGVLATVSEDDPNLADTVKKELVKKVSKEKGKYLYDMTVMFGRMNDDLIMNRLTVVLQAFWFKKPAFIKPNYNRNSNRN